MLKRNKAFTLAEVLITLGIIGVVAALTIPNLVKNYQEKVLITQFKKTYSVLSQAHQKMLSEYGTPTAWDVTCMNDIANIYAPFMQTDKIVAPANSSTGDTAAMGYQDLAVTDLRQTTHLNIYGQIKLTDGTILFFNAPWAIPSGLACTNTSQFCFIITADVNGAKPPNRWGVDVFDFMPTAFGVYPRGSSILSWGANKCQTTTNPGSNGSSCGNWILQHENMDYLKCLDQNQTSYCVSY